MPSVDSYTSSGTKSAGKITLDKAVFGVEVKSHGLLKSVYQAYQDNGRRNLAVTKTRGEVAGSTKKPWRQKGTGRARFGSRYNPLWRGGGITFGPSGNENYTKKINSKAKHAAVKQALSLALKSGTLAIIDDFELKDQKTSSAVKLLSKLEAKGRTLVVVAQPTAATRLAVRNIGSVKLIAASYLNVFDLLNCDKVVITKSSLDIISTWLNPARTQKPETAK